MVPCGFFFSVPQMFEEEPIMCLKQCKALKMGEKKKRMTQPSYSVRERITKSFKIPKHKGLGELTSNQSRGERGSERTALSLQSRGIIRGKKKILLKIEVSSLRSS